MQSLTSLHPSLASMKVNTAIGFVLLGLALRVSDAAQGQHRRRRQALAGCSALLGAMTLLEYAFEVEQGIDQLLVEDPWSTAFPGRMSIVTALHFVLLGLSVVVLDRRLGRREIRPAEWLALLAALSSLLALLGYAYGVRSLYAVRPFNTIAMHTALAFVFSSVGVFCARPRTGVMGLVTGSDPGGIVARRLLPAVILLPAGLGRLRLQGQELGWYDSGFGIALFAVSQVVCLGALVCWTATVLRASDASRGEAETRLRTSEDDLATTLRSIGDPVIATDSTGS